MGLATLIRKTSFITFVISFLETVLSVLTGRKSITPPVILTVEVTTLSGLNISFSAYLSPRLQVAPSTF